MLVLVWLGVKVPVDETEQAIESATNREKSYRNEVPKCHPAGSTLLMVRYPRYPRGGRMTRLLVRKSHKNDARLMLIEVGFSQLISE